MSTFATALLSAISMLALSLPPAANAQQDGTAVYLDTKPLFNMVLGRQQLSAAQLAQNVQKNLDSALMDLQGEPKVTVSTIKNLPAISLNGHFILDVDDATAAALHTKPLLLCQLWAGLLRQALRDQVANNDVSYETGTITLSAVAPSQPAAPASLRFARLPAGTILNVVLETDVHTAALRAGDEVSAVTTSDVTLPSGEVLSHGTRVIADVIAINTDSMFGPACVKMSFDRMQLASGAQFPIAAGMLSGSGRVDSVIIHPQTDYVYRAGQPLQLQLETPAQIAITGTIM